MKIFNSISEFDPSAPTIVTLGTFDGVHIGHRKIIERLVGSAAAADCQSLVLTFFPHPRMVLQDQSEIKLLTTIRERSQLLERAGLDNLVIHPFDKEFSRLTAEEFVKDILVDAFNIKKIIIGHDHRFGRNRTANIDDLIKFGEQYDFEVERISSQEINDVSVSSTKIRNALMEGQVELANKYLGYPYFLTGRVVKGKQIGRTIGYPTANIDVQETYKLIPKQGIYVVSSLIDDAIVYGMMSIGTNPTVGGTEQTIEIYYFDFDRDIYDLIIPVSILHRLRDEETYESLEVLKDQLQEDQRLSMEYLSGHL